MLRKAKNKLKHKITTIKHAVPYSSFSTTSITDSISNAYVENIDPQLLCDAAAQGNLDLVTDLITQGIDVNGKSSEGNPALILALYNNHLKIAELLIENNADVNSTTKVNDAVIHYMAVKPIYNPLLEKLLSENKINIHAKEKNGNNALHFAANNTDCKANVATLLKYGLKVNNKNNDGNTSLHIAANRGSKEIVELLLDRGADVKIANNKGETAAMFAKKNGHNEIAELLNLIGTFRGRLAKTNCKDADIPEKLRCPISHELMNDPIAVSSGYIYDRESLVAYFKTKGNPAHIECPMTRDQISITELSNKTCIYVKNDLEEFVSAQEKEMQKENKIQGYIENNIFTENNENYYSKDNEPQQEVQEEAKRELK